MPHKSATEPENECGLYSLVEVLCGLTHTALNLLQDGNVYEAIYTEARKSPLNRSRRMRGWDKFSKVLDIDFISNKNGQRHVPAAKL